MMGKLTLLLAIGLSAPVQAEQLMDPTRPANQPVVQGQTPSQSKEALQLDAIVKRGDRHFAVIGGQVVWVGGKWQQFEVTSIDATRVILVAEQTQKILQLPHSVSIKKESNNDF